MLSIEDFELAGDPLKAVAEILRDLFGAAGDDVVALLRGLGDRVDLLLQFLLGGGTFVNAALEERPASCSPSPRSVPGCAPAVTAAPARKAALFFTGASSIAVQSLR